MSPSPGTLRPAAPDDFAEIDALLHAAFGGPEEAALIARLRRDGDTWHERVMDWNGHVAGYFALTRMVAPRGWACLAPVAVRPEWQRGALAIEGTGAPWRIGTEMIRTLALAVQAGADDMPGTVVVLGEPDFYGPAGFSLHRAQNLRSPYPIAHTLIARPGDDAPEATLVYPAAFGN